MHEYGIARDIVRQAVAEAVGCGAAKVTILHIDVGSLEPIDQEALAFGVRAATQDTMAQGAVVSVTKIEGSGIVLDRMEVEGAD